MFIFFKVCEGNWSVAQQKKKKEKNEKELNKVVT